MTLNSSTVSAGQDATANQYNNMRLDIIEKAGERNTSGGSGNAFTLSLDAQLTSYTPGLIIKFKANHTITGPTTVNVNSISIKSLKNLDGKELGANFILTSNEYIFIYNGTEFRSISQLGRKLGGNGSDGPLNISSGTTNLTLVNDFVEKNYSNITISGSALLDIIGATGNLGGVAYIKCAGDFTMSGGTIDMSGQGGIGGAVESDGFQGRNTFDSSSIHHYGQGGISGNQPGGVGILGPSELSAISSPTGFFTGGGGGGGEDNSFGGIGGKGGGLLIIEIGGDLNFSGGTIQSNGSDGAASVGGGGGGGGGGGSIIILYNTLISETGTLQSDGGNGGGGVGVSTSGGGGGAGYSNGGQGSAGGAGTNGVSNSFGSGGTGGSTPNGGGGGGAGLTIKSNINTL